MELTHDMALRMVLYPYRSLDKILPASVKAAKENSAVLVAELLCEIRNLNLYPQFEGWLCAFRRWDAQSRQIRGWSSPVVDESDVSFRVAAELNRGESEITVRSLEEFLDVFARTLGGWKLWQCRIYGKLYRLHPDERMIPIPDHLIGEVDVEVEIRHGQGYVLSDGTYLDPVTGELYACRTED